MADFYYLYDPADNLSMAQAIHLANTDGGMSYIVPFAIKDGTVNPADPASAALQTINAAIAAAPLNSGGSDNPISNLIDAATARALVTDAGWAAIKAMVKASINQSPPAGWSEASLDDGATRYSVISSRGYSELNTSVFVVENGVQRWGDADTSQFDRGNPYVAYGGKITASVFLDYAGHFAKRPTTVGELSVGVDGRINSGQMRANFNAQIGADLGNPLKGLEIDAPGASVILANFSVTTQGFGYDGTARDDLSSLTTAGRSTGVPLSIYSGEVLLKGDLVIDQVTQVVSGTNSIPAAIKVSGAGSKVVVDNAAVYLGAVRGYRSLINVEDNASLKFSQSKIYGFSSSNGNAGTLPVQGLDWAGFGETNGSGSAAAAHLITAQNGGSVLLDRTQLLRENAWNPSGDFGTILDGEGTVGRWQLNDYRTIADGDLLAAAGGAITIRDSQVLGSIRTGVGAGNLLIENSVVAGTPLGRQAGQSLVQLEGGTATIHNSLVDSVETRYLSGGSLSTNGTTHILASGTPWSVSTTTDAEYLPLASFAGSSSVTSLSAWADKDQAAAQSKVGFQFYGPQAAVKSPSSKARTLSGLLSEAALPQVGNGGVTTYSLKASFQEAVSGFDAADLQTALGTAAVAAGWQVPAAPVSRDSGRSWSFQLTSPAGFSTPVSLQLAAGAANASLVTGLASDASNSFTLAPLGSSSGGGGSSSSSGGGTSGGGSASTPTTPGAGSSTSPGLDNDNLDESSQNNNGIVIDANKDGTPDADQSNVAGIRRVGDGTSPGDYAALAVAANYTLNAVTLLPITNNQVQVSLPSGGSVSTPIPSGVTALLEPLEFYVENVTPGATIEAELFIPDNFGQQTDAYMRFNYITKRFEEYVDVNGGKLYQLLDENADGKVDRVIFSLTDGDPRWDGDGLANGVIIDPGSPIDAQQNYSGKNKKDTITGNLLGNTINGKAGNDRLSGDLGRDLIKGGKGNDKITGGEQGDLLIGGRGRDHFIYTSAADSSVENPNQQDEIRRFHHQDRLDLRRFDADTTETGQQAFAFIGARSFSGTAGALRFHAGLLSADLDGDRTADFAVAIDGSLKASQLML